MLQSARPGTQHHPMCCVFANKIAAAWGQPQFELQSVQVLRLTNLPTSPLPLVSSVELSLLSGFVQDKYTPHMMDASCWAVAHAPACMCSSPGVAPHCCLMTHDGTPMQKGPPHAAASVLCCVHQHLVTINAWRGLTCLAGAVCRPAWLQHHRQPTHHPPARRSSGHAAPARQRSVPAGLQPA